MKFAKDPAVLAALDTILNTKRPAGARPNPGEAFVTSSPATEQLHRAGKLVEEFQSRPVRGREWRSLDLPTEVWPVAEPHATWYWSDKRDPNDPEGEGRQGVWKLFRHGHDVGCGLQLYTIGREARNRGNAMLVAWPEAWAWLGDFIRMDGRGTDRPFNLSAAKGEWGLFASPNANALLALPYGRWRGRMYLWHGGHLTVTWRGIEG